MSDDEQNAREDTAAAASEIDAATSPRSSRPVRLAGGLTLAVLLVVAGVWTGVARPWDTAPRSEPGEIIARGLSLDEELGDPIDVVYPTGGLTVRFGEPTRETPVLTMDEAPFPKAPRGGHYLPVELETVVPDGLRAMRLPDSQMPPPQVTVAVGDQAYDLGPYIADLFWDDGRMQLTRVGFLLAVDRGPVEPVMTVSFDGEDQVITPDGVTDAGTFAALPTSGSTPSGECDAEVLPSGWASHGDPTSCTLAGPDELPWVGGLGWAPEGQVWQVSTLDLEIPAVIEFTTPAEEQQRASVQNSAELTPVVSADDAEPAAMFPTTEATNALTLSPPGTWTVISGPVPPGTTTELGITVQVLVEPVSDEEPGPEESELELQFSAHAA
ncbi:hypothetical protein ACFQS2_10180 [Brachybacterium sp. GCM10030267]|uniref:hypothetical protein n=1 Tax=Brachybacterium sp. GCM10030267 TaxID=3273381 RepID=UPI00361DED4B